MVFSGISLERKNKPRDGSEHPENKRRRVGCSFSLDYARMSVNEGYIRVAFGKRLVTPEVCQRVHQTNSKESTSTMQSLYVGAVRAAATKEKFFFRPRSFVSMRDPVPADNTVMTLAS